jgi:hypothetical protein
LKITRLAFLLTVISVSLMVTPSVHASPVVVTLTPSSQVVPQGTVTTVEVALTGAPSGTPAGTSGYDLSLSGFLSGASYSFSPKRVPTGSGSGSSTLKIDAGSAPLYCPGTYSYTVTATNTTIPDSGTASGSITVVPVGSPLSVTVTTDKSTYKIGDKITIQMTASRPAESRLTISGPSGSPSVFVFIFTGPSYSLTKTLTASTVGRYTVTFEADDFCSGFSSSVAYFDVTPDTYDVSISIDGVPPTVSIPLTVDSQDQGSIGGSEIKKLTFKLDTAHTVTVAQYVDGDAGVRYFDSQNTWTVGSAGSHTFQYTTEYLFTVKTDPDGVAQVTGGGWVKDGSSVQTSQAPDTLAGAAGTRYAFKGWTVDGALQSGNPISLTMDKPHTAVATYETQYQLIVDSQYGDPQGTGYYASGSTATFSVTTPVGVIIQQVFAGWDGDFTGTSPSGSITMDKPHRVHANWATSYFQLYILVGVLAAIAVVAALLLWRRRQAMGPPVTKPTPPTTEEPEGPAEATLPPSGETVKCPSCGTDVPVGQTYCQNCGSKIE